MPGEQRQVGGHLGADGLRDAEHHAARDTVRAIEGGLDIAMPGPRTVYGEALATAVREGRVAEETVDEAVRRVLRLAARVGALDGAPPAVCEPPVEADGRALAREIARRSFVLLRNEGAVLPLRPRELRRVALIGDTARHARVMGGGSATVFPERVVTPLAGLRRALSPPSNWCTPRAPTRAPGSLQRPRASLCARSTGTRTAPWWPTCRSLTAG
ncbi:glycoside hydrolase family 3 C-terminal domain-containing protein [Streptomyces sp. MNU76]|uniref:glycoside hydrolase family 3 C-terminal domain-containing protein n=1 Tax=Streptomyces sp. MNU76 TaxID=2560026 RepID=UPI001E517CFA|nr:glycoside hydrolase family 3 C-terminal domain-containing protein [Streptomyces sp. MNU76]MCC9704375.1 glycoside hydrolase family 3 C-terminal domain-containing protein [Streptomyces sp. MNU76]